MEWLWVTITLFHRPSLGHHGEHELGSDINISVRKCPPRWLRVLRRLSWTTLRPVQTVLGNTTPLVGFTTRAGSLLNRCSTRQSDTISVRYKLIIIVVQCSRNDHAFNSGISVVFALGGLSRHSKLTTSCLYSVLWFRQHFIYPMSQK